MQLASSLKTSTPCRCHGSHGFHGSQGPRGYLWPMVTYFYIDCHNYMWPPGAGASFQEYEKPGKQSELDGTPVPTPCFPTASSFR